MIIAFRRQLTSVRKIPTRSCSLSGLYLRAIVVAFPHFLTLFSPAPYNARYSCIQ
jgi:hypothetical protein